MKLQSHSRGLEGTEMMLKMEEFDSFRYCSAAENPTWLWLKEEFEKRWCWEVGFGSCWCW
jgi:hypothetical protein